MSICRILHIGSKNLTALLYLNEEFRRHQKVDNPLHIIGFLSQWKMYLDSMPQTENASQFKGKKLDPTVYEKVRALLFSLPITEVKLALTLHVVIG